MCQGPRTGAPWGYEAHNGPAVWAGLDPAYRTCALGSEQSPIDLCGARKADLPPVEFEYRRAGATIENTGRSIQVNPLPGSGIVLDGVRYELRQFHFHHGGEHTVEGRRLPLEMHLVHEDAEGSTAVVGVLFREGDANDTLAPVWAQLPALAAPKRALPGEVDLPSLLPEHRTMWRYRGSFTTPPCTEKVAWAIFVASLAVSRGQIDAFASIHPHNYRPVQPIGERILYRG